MSASQGLCSKSISIEEKEGKLSCEIYKFMILWDFDFMILRFYTLFFNLCLIYNFSFFQRLDCYVYILCYVYIH